MEHLNNLNNVLKKIRDTSNKIIERMLPIMRNLEDTDGDLVEEFVEQKPEFSPDEAISILQDTSCKLIEDAETIQDEIDSFSAAVVRGSDAIAEGEDEYPFLLQTWSGDMYDECELEGLQKLAEDLKSQLDEIDEDKILEAALESV